MLAHLKITCRTNCVSSSSRLWLWLNGSSLPVLTSFTFSIIFHFISFYLSFIFIISLFLFTIRWQLPSCFHLYHPFNKRIFLMERYLSSISMSSYFLSTFFFINISVDLIETLVTKYCEKPPLKPGSHW